MQFSNGFSGTVNKSKGEVMIRFIQQSPDFISGPYKEDDEDYDGEIITEDVATIVMGKKTAQNLLDTLKEMLEEDDESEE